MRIVHLAEIEHASDGAQPFCLLVPTAHLGFHRIAKPSAPRRKWAEMIPWMLEERLLQAPQQLHFAWYGSADNPECLDVWCVDRARLEAWLSQCGRLGELTAIIPDVFALPATDAGWRVHIREGEALVRTGKTAGFACPAAWLPTRISSDPPARIELSGDESVTAQLLPQLEAAGISVDRSGDLPAMEKSTQAPVNLLPVELRRAIVHNRGASMRWAAVAVVGLLALLSWPLSIYAETRYLERETARIAQHLGGNATDPALLQLRQRAAESGIRPLLHSLDPLLANCPTCKIDRLEIEPDQARIELEQPQQLLPAARAAGWQVEPEADRTLVLRTPEGGDA